MKVLRRLTMLWTMEVISTMSAAMRPRGRKHPERDSAPQITKTASIILFITPELKSLNSKT
jgi:hypothetical protein